MRSRGHLRLFALAIVVWAAFWVGGWPDYYRQYSLTTQLVICGFVLAAFWWQGTRFILPARAEQRRGRALWLSFYFTVPFAILDAAYCGAYLGRGPRFLVEYWYLTIFYVLPWVLFVPMARLSRASAEPTDIEVSKGRDRIDRH